MKKLLSVLLTSLMALFLTLSFGLVVKAATSSGITLVQDGNYHYVHLENETNSEHITNIADTNTLIQSGFTQLTGNVGGTLEVDAPLGASVFVIANASGQIVHSQPIGLNATVNFHYDPDYLYEIVIDGYVYTWNLGYYGKFYFIQDKEPVLSGQTAFVTNIDNPLPESTIRSYISAFDDVDGDITHLIQLVSSDYQQPYSVGQFEIRYSVADTSGNTAYLKVFVLVRDVTAPSFNPFEFIDNISYTEVFNIQTLKNDIMLHASDNFYTKDQLTLTLDSDGYTANKTVPGSYELLFTLKDPSNNTYQFPITIFVIDDIAPIVSYNPVIVKPATSNLTISDILKDITATDAIDGNVTNSLTIVSDGYTGNGNRVGVYQIVLEVSDLSGNVNQFTITVEVLDNVPPVFMVIPGHFIRVEQILTLTNEEIIEILQRTGQLQINGAMSWSYITNEYSGNEEIPGLYAMSMRFVSPSGSSEIESFVIEVLPSVDWDGVVEDSNKWYEDVVEWMKDHPIYTVLIFLGATLALIGLTVVIVQLTSSHPHTKKTKYSKYIGKR